MIGRTNALAGGLGKCASGTVSLSETKTITVNGLGFKPRIVCVFANYNNTSIDYMIHSVVATKDYTFVDASGGYSSTVQTSSTYITRTFNNGSFTLVSRSDNFDGDYRWIAYE